MWLTVLLEQKRKKSYISTTDSQEVIRNLHKTRRNGTSSRLNNARYKKPFVQTFTIGLQNTMFQASDDFKSDNSKIFCDQIFPNGFQIRNLHEITLP